LDEKTSALTAQQRVENRKDLSNNSGNETELLNKSSLFFTDAKFILDLAANARKIEVKSWNVRHLLLAT